MSKAELLKLFPLTTKYDQVWVEENSLLHNVLYYAESLTNELNLKPGMRVLDLGCGNGVSSIFLAKEFRVNVWAVDKEVNPTENYTRSIEQNCEDKVFPLQLDARRLPFPRNFFDAVISIDSFSYYGTDDWYLPYLSQFIKPGGKLAIAEWCFSKELHNFNEAPEFLKRCYTEMGFYSLHSLEWWKNHFEKAGLFAVDNLEYLPGNELILNDFIEEFKDTESEEIIVDALKNDKEHIINTFRVIGTRTNNSAYLDDFEDHQEV